MAMHLLKKGEKDGNDMKENLILLYQIFVHK